MNSYVNNVVEPKGRFSLVQHIKMSILDVDKSTANDVYDVDCVSANSFGDTECYDKLTVLLVLVFASYTPTMFLEKKRHILSFDVLNCISKLPFAFFQKVILSTPNFNFEITSVSCWDTECYIKRQQKLP